MSGVCCSSIHPSIHPFIPHSFLHFIHSLTHLTHASSSPIQSVINQFIHSVGSKVAPALSLITYSPIFGDCSVIITPADTLCCLCACQSLPRSRSLRHQQRPRSRLKHQQQPQVLPIARDSHIRHSLARNSSSCRRTVYASHGGRHAAHDVWVERNER